MFHRILDHVEAGHSTNIHRNIKASGDCGETGKLTSQDGVDGSSGFEKIKYPDVLGPRSAARSHHPPTYIHRYIHTYIVCTASMVVGWGRGNWGPGRQTDRQASRGRRIRTPIFRLFQLLVLVCPGGFRQMFDLPVCLRSSLLICPLHETQRSLVPGRWLWVGLVCTKSVKYRLLCRNERYGRLIREAGHASHTLFTVDAGALNW